jgi:hypothetical protein
VNDPVVANRNLYPGDAIQSGETALSVSLADVLDRDPVAEPSAAQLALEHADSARRQRRSQTI